jgi:sugar lactone lactonase YvrE
MRITAGPVLLLPALLCCSSPKPPAPPVPPVNVSILATVGDSASTIEGIAEFEGKLYVCDWKDGTIYRVDPADPTPVAVGGLPIKPGTAILGVIADAAGDLYFAEPDSGIVYRVKADRLGAKDFNRKKDATRFATGAMGANAMTFDYPGGHLWITGGPTGNLYQVSAKGGPVEVAASGYAQVSADTTMPVRAYVVNGVTVDSRGVIYTANTGTGEISALLIGAGYKPKTITTFVKDPRLVGADGIFMDSEDNLWVDANYRNTLARIGPDRSVTIVASSTPSGSYTDSTMIPAYPQAGVANGLRFPAELKKVGNTMYIGNLNLPYGANTGQTFKGASIAAVTLP